METITRKDRGSNRWYGMAAIFPIGSIAVAETKRNFLDQFDNVIFIVKESGLSDGVLTVITDILDYSHLASKQSY